jgi:hypothetical protein
MCNTRWFDKHCMGHVGFAASPKPDQTFAITPMDLLNMSWQRCEMETAHVNHLPVENGGQRLARAPRGELTAAP